MFELPEEINIGGWDIKVVIDNDMDDYGQFQADERIIKINVIKHKSNESLFVSFYHECLHAVLFISGRHFEFEGEREEGLVRCIENILLKTMYDQIYLEEDEEEEVDGWKKGKLDETDN